MSLEVTRRAVLAGAAALLGSAPLSPALSRPQPVRPLLVADRRLAAGALCERAAPHRPAGASLLVVAEGTAPGATDVHAVSPRALLHVPPERLAALLRLSPALHLAPPARIAAVPSDAALGEAMLALLGSCGETIQVGALALETAESRDWVGAAAMRMGWAIRPI